jgi:tetrahydromethanopterin S-methyltransferase subunit G
MKTKLFDNDEYRELMKKLDDLEKKSNEFLNRIRVDEKIHQDDIIFLRAHSSITD